MAKLPQILIFITSLTECIQVVIAVSTLAVHASPHRTVHAGSTPFKSGITDAPVMVSAVHDDDSLPPKCSALCPMLRKLLVDRSIDGDYCGK